MLVSAKGILTQGSGSEATSNVLAALLPWQKMNMALGECITNITSTLQNWKRKQRGDDNRMPLKIICKKCGYVLFESEDLKSPQDILAEKYDNKCPKCGRRIKLDDFDNTKIEIRRRH